MSYNDDIAEGFGYGIQTALRVLAAAQYLNADDRERLALEIIQADTEGLKTPDSIVVDGQRIPIQGEVNANLKPSAPPAWAKSAPADFVNPDWAARGKVHDWRNHVPEDLREAWATLAIDARAAVSVVAVEQASREEWD